MKMTILTIFAATLFAGSMIQTASAREHRHISRAYRTAPVVVGETFHDSYASDPRNAYGWSYPDYGYWASRVEGGAISAPAGH